MTQSALLPMGKASFSVRGQACHELIVTDLELDNCCIKIPLFLRSAFGGEPTLDHWHLSFPALPRSEVKAKVAWVREGTLPDPAFFEAGVRFIDLPERYARALAAYVDSVKNEAMAPEEFDNMPA